MLTKPLLESVSKFPSDELLRQLAGAEDGFDLNRLRQVRRFKQARDAFDWRWFWQVLRGSDYGYAGPHLFARR